MEWVQVIQTAVMAAAAFLVWLWGKDREALAVRIDALEDRFERGDKEYSRLTSIVQVLMDKVGQIPEDMRRQFMSADRVADLFEEARRDRERIWKEIQALRDSARGGDRGDRRR